MNRLREKIKAPALKTKLIIVRISAETPSKISHPFYNKLLQNDYILFVFYHGNFSNSIIKRMKMSGGELKGVIERELSQNTAKKKSQIR